MNESYEPVHFSQSKTYSTTSASLIPEIIILLFSESEVYSTSSVDWLPND